MDSSEIHTSKMFDTYWVVIKPKQNRKSWLCLFVCNFDIFSGLFHCGTCSEFATKLVSCHPPRRKRVATLLCSVQRKLRKCDKTQFAFIAVIINKAVASMMTLTGNQKFSKWSRAKVENLNVDDFMLILVPWENFRI